MSNAINMKETQTYTSMKTEAGLIGWDLTLVECEMIAKTIFNGCTDSLSLLKNKNVPVVLLIQNLKGDKIAFGAVSYEKDDDSDEEGSWEYYWSYDCDKIPENATVYTIDQTEILQTIAKRGHNLCSMTVGVLNYLAVLACSLFNVVKDTLDQQNLADGEEFIMEIPGFFQATVKLENGEKVFGIIPSGEMKSIIKNDQSTENK